MGGSLPPAPDRRSRLHLGLDQPSASSALSNSKNSDSAHSVSSSSVMSPCPVTEARRISSRRTSFCSGELSRSNEVNNSWTACVIGEVLPRRDLSHKLKIRSRQKQCRPLSFTLLLGFLWVKRIWSLHFLEVIQSLMLRGRLRASEECHYQTLPRARGAAKNSKGRQPTITPPKKKRPPGDVFPRV